MIGDLTLWQSLWKALKAQLGGRLSDAADLAPIFGAERDAVKVRWKN